MTKTDVQMLKNYIGGQWIEAETSQTEEVYNPATGEIIAEVPLSTKKQMSNMRYRQHKKHLPLGRKKPVPRRARILFKYQQLLVDKWDELAELVTIENGKSITEAKGEVQRGIECVEFAAGAPTLMMGKQLPDIASGLESGMYRYPIGVIGGITPFNFPMMVPCWMFPLAIACGNTFVLKPSERTPILAARLAELFEEAGIPKGVLNIVNGAHDVVNGLLEHQKRSKPFHLSALSQLQNTSIKKGTEHGKRVQALAGAKKNHPLSSKMQI
ncbi:hypothetical protein BsIDN1_34450 [Bacillus safensis]|uniref:Aldehyde dehydrogenase domain-containing protein n=1 Tax=Bacillus safensis TaxID=561879 RepID=A0A5S9M8J8_BACIA|nr:hypothetical protein BsIDN1_34450 [Bacillus safensis]